MSIHLAMAEGAGRTVLFVPVGSFGDLFPMLGIAKGLRAAGATCIFASGPEHKDLIEREGFRVKEVPITTQGDFADCNMQFAQTPDGGESFWRDVLLPQLSGGIDALVPLVRKCDVVVGGFVSICVPTAAEIARKPWVSLQLTGLPFMSATDPPVHAAAAYKLWTRGRSALVWRVAHSVAQTVVPRQVMRKAGERLAEERSRRGLEPGDGDLFLETMSPFLTLGMFPKQLWPHQADWPQSTVTLGPVSYESHAAAGGAVDNNNTHAAEPLPSFDEEDAGLSSELRAFLLGCAAPGDTTDAASSAGAAEGHTTTSSSKKPLVVFALGSVAVESAAALAGCFASAAKAAGMRAVVLAGKQCAAARAAAAPAAAVTVGPCGWDAARDLLFLPFAPYAALFKHASVVVHQGGAGTTARALCAGVPTVILPLGMDTWDNALRAERAGVSVTVPREGITAAGLSAGILRAAELKAAAVKVGDDAARDAENAVPAAVEAILRLAAAYGATNPPPAGAFSAERKMPGAAPCAAPVAFLDPSSSPAADDGGGSRPRQPSAGPAYIQAAENRSGVRTAAALATSESAAAQLNATAAAVAVAGGSSVTTPATTRASSNDGDCSNVSPSGKSQRKGSCGAAASTRLMV